MSEKGNQSPPKQEPKQDEEERTCLFMTRDRVADCKGPPKYPRHRSACSELVAPAGRLAADHRKRLMPTVIATGICMPAAPPLSVPTVWQGRCPIQCTGSPGQCHASGPDGCTTEKPVETGLCLP